MIDGQADIADASLTQSKSLEHGKASELPADRDDAKDGFLSPLMKRFGVANWYG